MQIATHECSFEFTLREELVNRDVPDDDTPRTAKYPWQRIPLQPSKVGSGRLTLQLGRYYPTRSWSDRRRWTLDDKLGAIFAELDARVAEAAEQRRRRETELLARQHAWDAAVAAAKQAYVVEFNRRRLHEQADHHGQAAKLRDYAHTLDEVAGGCADPAAAEPIRTWQRWAREEADRIDPLGHLDTLRYLEPDTITPDDYAPFMPAGMNPHQRPTK